MSWKYAIHNVSARVIEKRRMPLVIKEVAWRALDFTNKCRRSNPLSFALRPIFGHKHLHIAIGVIIAMTITGTALFSPVDSLAQESTGGGPIALSVLSEGEINPTTTESIKIPLKYNYISQRFWALHPGIDFATHTGEPVNPVMNGKVILVAHDTWDYGKHVIVAHANKYTSLYAHLSKIYVQEGQTVDTKTIIGEAGSTGRSTGPHLHLEIHDELDRPFNPATFLGIK